MEKNKIMMISIIVLLVALLGTIVGVAFWVIKTMTNTDDPTAEVNNNPAVVTLTREQIMPVDFTDPIGTNLLTEKDGTNYVIRIKLSVGVNNIDEKKTADFLETLTANEAVMRDAIIGILHNKTNTELSKPDGKEILKAEILESLQQIFENNLIVEVNMGEMYISKTP